MKTEIPKGYTQLHGFVLSVLVIYQSVISFLFWISYTLSAYLG